MKIRQIKKINASFVTVVMLLSTVTVFSLLPTTSAEPDGTIEIKNWGDLYNISNDLSANYILINNLDSSTDGYDTYASSSANDGAGWLPIGNHTHAFTGTFNGENHTISDLFIDRENTDYVGLFGRNSGATTKNIGLINVNITGQYHVGGLTGYMGSSSEASNSYVTGKVTGTGIIFTVAGIGGLIGRMSGSSVISNSYATVNVTGYNGVGGLIGYAGWLPGDGGSVSNSYSTGKVTGNQNVGGLTGFNWGSISNSYSTGVITGNYSVGGLIGGNAGSIYNSHYNIDAVLINGGHHVTIGGLFEEQYNDWFGNDMYLNISNYNETLMPSDDYYDIRDVQGLRDLLGFADRTEYKFRLISDIDLSTDPDLYIPYFSAEFNGNNYTISNLDINLSFAAVGLFGYINNKGTIVNTRVINADIRGYSSVGGLAGLNIGSISNSYSTGNITGYYGVGGLAGLNIGSISNSYSTGNITGYHGVGGLIGRMSGSSVISNSYATVNVTGNHHVGGLIGWNFGCSISNSYSTGNITGDQNVGGLVGCNYNGAITNSYSTGIITGTDYVGGLVGWNYNGAITNSFYDSETSGQSDTGKGIPKTTSQMKDFITFNNAGWDIDYTDVDLNDGYPYLAWQNETDTSIWLIYGDTSSDHVLKVNIHTGLFRLLLYNKINATVQNTGNGTANNVNLTLSVEYGLLGLKKANKTINIISMQPNESQSIEITGLRGFGFIGINITAFSDETEKVTDTATGLILGPFIILGRKFI